MENYRILKWLGISIFVLSTLGIITVIAIVSMRAGDNGNVARPDPKQPPAGRTGQAGEPVSVLAELIAQSQMLKFADAAEAAEWLADNPIDSSDGYGYKGMNMMVDEMAFDSPTSRSSGPSIGLQSAGSSEAFSSVQASDYSQTNIQVAGVDEADIIKNDGKYIYALVKNDLYIVMAFPGEEARVLSKISFKNRPQDLYLSGSRLVVFGAQDQIWREPYVQEFRRRGSYTFFKVFDISDPRNPRQTRDLEMEGSYSNSRLIGDFVYFSTTVNNYNFFDVEPVLPRILEGGAEISTDRIAGDIYYFAVPYESYNFTSIAAINIRNDRQEISRESYLMSGAQNMYVSPDNIYISYTKRVSEYRLAMEVMRELVWPRLNEREQEMIDKIEETDNFILTPAEKQYKIEEILERWGRGLPDDELTALTKELEEAMAQKYRDIGQELEKTVVHRVAVKDGVLSYGASGDVPGYVLNQFSMDESDGNLRIATTKSREWSRGSRQSSDSYSNVYVLDQSLKILGRLEYLAEGERIYSARFMGKRLYLVTFKEIDPLFAIDLSDPTDPRVLGELKIPGFSNYLHPYDENTIIGLGKDAFESQWGGVRTGGVKLSLFDVSDPSAPREVDNYILGDSGSDSIALNDHKAFLFSREKNLLVIPVSIRESQIADRSGNATFYGAAVFKVDPTGFELKGRVDHSQPGQSLVRDRWGGHNYYDNTVRRSLYMEDDLYTFSHNYISINRISDLDQVKKVKLVMDGSGDDFEIIN